MESKLKIHKTTVPGDMTMEEWQNGGFSKFIHGDETCRAEIIDAIDNFVLKINDFAHEKYMTDIYPVDTLLNFINNYKP